MIRNKEIPGMDAKKIGGRWFIRISDHGRELLEGQHEANRDRKHKEP